MHRRRVQVVSPSLKDPALSNPGRGSADWERVEVPGRYGASEKTLRGATRRLKSFSIAISDRTPKVPQGAPHPSLSLGLEAARRFSAPDSGEE